MTSSVLDQVVERQKSREAEAEKLYRELVRLIANNPAKPPAVDKIDETIRAVGKTADDLRSDVQQAQYRIGLRQKITDAEKLQSELPGIVEAIAEADAILKAAEETHLQAVRPLRHRREQITQATSEAETARRELQATRPDEYDQPLIDLEQKLRVAERQRQAIDKRLSELKSACVELRNRSEGRTVHPSDAANFRELQNQITDVEARAIAAAKVVADLLQQQEALIAEILAS